MSAQSSLFWIGLGLLGLALGFAHPARADAEAQRALARSAASPAAQVSSPSPQAAPLPSGRAAKAQACLAAAAEAEAKLGLPAGLLSAVTIIESAAHPFAIGGAGGSVYATSPQQALARAGRAGGNASGGCFQIHIAVHGGDDPSWVFEPWRSAVFAGELLATHAGDDGSDWAGAIIRYAGARPGTEAARVQLCRVASAMAALGRGPLPQGVGTDDCRQGELRTAQAKTRQIAALARGAATTVATAR